MIAIIDAWLAGFTDNAAVLAHLELHRVPAAPVLNPIEALTEPYFLERKMVRFIEDPVLGPLAIPGFPLRFSAQPECPDLIAPLLGEHNAAVLSRLLDYDAQRIATLVRHGVLIAGER